MSMMDARPERPIQPKSLDNMDLPSSTPNRQTILDSIGPPIIAFLIAQIFLSLVISAAAFNPSDYRTWERGDSGQYLDIAAKGYTLRPSDGSLYPRGNWEGNSGWMPLYPWMIRALVRLGLNLHAAAMGLTLLFHLLTLILLGTRFLTDVNRRRRFCCLLLAAFFPGQIYQHAVFPISLFTFLALLALDRLLRGRWLIAGLAGMAAAAAYSTGFLLSGVLGLFILLSAKSKRNPRTFILRAFLCAALPIAGLGLVLLVQRSTVGAWNGFFLVQAKYGLGLRNPLNTFLWQINHFRRDPRLAGVPQLLIVDLLVLASCGWVGATWSRRPNMDRLLAIYAGVFWFFTLLMGQGVSPLRPAALLLLMTPLMRRLPVWVQVALIPVFAVISAAAVDRFLVSPAP